MDNVLANQTAGARLIAAFFYLSPRRGFELRRLSWNGGDVFCTDG